MALRLDTPLSDLTKVGKMTSSRLKRLGLDTVEDLLFFLPTRYEDYSKITPLAEVHEGLETTVEGIVQLISAKRTSRKRMLLTQALLHDGDGYLRLIWFNQPYIAKQLEQGVEIRCSGKVDQDGSGLVMRNPQYELADRPPVHTGRLLPVYPLTDGLTNKQLRFLQTQAAEAISEMVDWMPPEAMSAHDLIPLADALAAVHFPDSMEAAEAGRRRMYFGDLLLMHLHTLNVREKNRAAKARKVSFKDDVAKEFVESLPWSLTGDQKRALWSVFQDIGEGAPMNRLLEGDVGSGKTVVAAGAMHHVASAGHQAVLMAPTSILAEQHFETLSKLFSPFVMRIGLVTGSAVAVSGQGERTNLKKKDAPDIGVTADILVGTHALFSESMKYRSIGLAVIDEQHRFGVGQRKALVSKNPDSLTPHLLSMTATPIPRTLSLTVFGDLDISVLKEKPANRQPVETSVLHGAAVSGAYNSIKKAVSEGRQAFVICPLIEESETMQSKAALVEAERLKEEVFPDLRIETLHGKMKPAEKDEVMGRMSDGKIDVLVCTSLVEVGIDIPNATHMLIEGAERFGLAQLHQFRGRIGRGEHGSVCFLRSDSRGPETMQRLKLLETTSDGFYLAEKDLEIRGPGTMIGKAQSGFGTLSAKLFSDPRLIEQTREEAEKLYPLIKEEKNTLLTQKLEQLSAQILLS